MAGCNGVGGVNDVHPGPYHPRSVGTGLLECCTDDLIDTWESTGGGCGYTPCADLEGDLCVDWLENKRHCEAEDGSTQEIVCCEGGFWDHWCLPEALEMGANP